LIVEGESDIVHCNTVAVKEALLLRSLVLPLNLPHFKEDSETDSFELQANTIKYFSTYAVTLVLKY